MDFFPVFREIRLNGSTNMAGLGAGQCGSGQWRRDQTGAAPALNPEPPIRHWPGSTRRGQAGIDNVPAQWIRARDKQRLPAMATVLLRKQEPMAHRTSLSPWAPAFAGARAGPRNSAASPDRARSALTDPPTRSAGPARCGPRWRAPPAPPGGPSPARASRPDADRFSPPPSRGTCAPPSCRNG